MVIMNKARLNIRSLDCRTKVVKNSKFHPIEKLFVKKYLNLLIKLWNQLLKSSAVLFTKIR